MENGGEVLFKIPNDFEEIISLIHYDSERNVLFAGNKEGKIRIWKIPKEWRSKSIDKCEREFEFSRKHLN